MSVWCSDCGEPLSGEEMKCPRCGSINKTKELRQVAPSPILRLRTKSAEKDERGKPIKEERIRVEGKTEHRITRDRSKKLGGKPETDVWHEVKVNGQTVHKPHLEPKSKRNST
jgi:phage FluMu protein Com